MAAQSILRERACQQCGASPITGYKFCGLACRGAHKTPSVRRYEATRARRAEAMATYPCEVCGRAVDYPGLGRPKQYCSDACRSKSEAARCSHRISKATRRATERGVDAERFDPIEVLERDGWRCHMCARQTPKRLRGSNDPRAPELDHIVPISKGGKHTRLNTACACRACNGAKGAGIGGQLRLVA